MTEVKQAGEERPANALVVYQAPGPRAQLAAKAVRLAKAALLIWGSVSLAGIVGAAVVYAAGGLDPFVPVPAQSAQLRTAHSTSDVQAAIRAGQLAARSVRRSTAAVSAEPGLLPTS